MAAGPHLDAGDDDKVAADDAPVANANASKSVQEIMSQDAEDESLRKYVAKCKVERAKYDAFVCLRMTRALVL